MGPDPANTELLSVDAAARKLPMRKADAINWLYDRGLVHAVGPGPSRIVVWDEVIAAIKEAPSVSREGTPKTATPETGASSRLPQSSKSATRLSKSIAEGAAWLES